VGREVVSCNSATPKDIAVCKVQKHRCASGRMSWMQCRMLDGGCCMLHGRGAGSSKHVLSLCCLVIPWHITTQRLTWYEDDMATAMVHIACAGHGHARSDLP
jgi:hypothetical protein